MPEQRICSFSGDIIEPGTGLMFIRRDGTVQWFANSKARKNAVKLKRNSRKVKWTRHYVKGGIQTIQRIATIVALKQGMLVDCIGGISMETTYVMVKPDGVQRGLVGEIIQRFERKGLQLVGLKQVIPSEEIAKEHYAVHAERPFFPGLIKFVTSGPVVCLSLIHI